MTKENEDQIVKELISIKKLLILTLYLQDIPSSEINKAAGIGASNIRGMFSKKAIKKALNKQKNEFLSLQELKKWMIKNLKH